MSVDSNQKVERGVITTGNSDGNQKPIRIILVNADGTPAGTVVKQAAQAASTATDVAGLKTDFNALLTKLSDAGVIG